MDIKRTQTASFSFPGKAIKLGDLKDLFDELSFDDDATVTLDITAESGTMGGAYYTTKIIVREES